MPGKGRHAAKPCAVMTAAAPATSAVPERLAAAQASYGLGAALAAALDAEQKAEAFCLRAAEVYGGRGPFARIAKAQHRHATALAVVMRRYGFPVPENAYLSGEKPLPAMPASPREACALAAQEESRVIALYDREWQPVAAGFDDIASVFDELRRASAERHLPAFAGRAERGEGHHHRSGGQCQGHGAGHHHDHEHGHGEGHCHAGEGHEHGQGCGCGHGRRAGHHGEGCDHHHG